MKKTRFLMAAGLIFFLSACAAPKFSVAPLPAKKAPGVSSQAKQIEHSLSPSLTLDATEYTFSHYMERLLFDALQKQNLIIGTNKKNNLHNKPVFLFQLDTGKIAWSLQSSTPNFSARSAANIPKRIILGDGRNTFAIDSENGKVIWQRPGGYILLPFSKNLAYSIQKSGGDRQIAAFDMQSGRTVWTRNNFDWGWWGHKVRLYEDKTLLFYGDGLHSFNLENGEGWDYEVDTAAVGGVGKVVALEILSAVSGGSVVNTAGTDRYENLTSNALIIGDEVYYAGNRILVCVDLKTGREIWKVKLPEIAAHSGLFKEDGHILMIAFGWCHKNKKITDYSKPYIARFDKENGSRLLYREVGLKSRVNDFSITEDGYYLVSAGRVILVDKKDPHTITTPAQPGENDPALSSKALKLVKNPQDYFVRKKGDGQRFTDIAALNTADSDLWVKTDAGFVHYNKHLEVQNQFPYSLLHYRLLELDSALLLRGFRQKGNNNNHIKVIAPAGEGRLLGEIKTGLAARNIHDELLVLWDNTRLTNTLTVLPLEELNSFLSRKTALSAR
ncbi:MAG: PQQ-binding-like beta-propeller repeat protein [Thermodesulfobacteriota bacterium]